LFGSLSASNQQYQGTQNALAQLKSMFGVAQNELQPFINAGSSEVPLLQQLLNPGSANKILKSLPGFKFESMWGTKTAENALSAEGLGGSSGPLAKAVSDYNVGLASTNYGSFVDNLLKTIGLGSGAAGSLAGAASSFGGPMASTAIAGGNALASG